MSALIELLALLIAPACGGALLLHLWQTRQQRSPYVAGSLAVGQIPLRIQKRAMAKRRWTPSPDPTEGEFA